MLFEVENRKKHEDPDSEGAPGRVEPGDYDAEIL